MNEGLVSYEEQLKALSLTDLITEFRHIKDQLDAAKEVKTNCQKRFDLIRLKVLPELADEEGVSTMTVDGIGRMGLSSDMYTSIRADDREVAYQWLRDHGHGDIIKETVNAGTLKSFCKEMVKNGEEIPECISATPYTRATLTKVK